MGLVWVLRRSRVTILPVAVFAAALLPGCGWGGFRSAGVHGFCLADVDGDGAQEIVAGSSYFESEFDPFDVSAGWVWVCKPDGSVLPGWPRRVPSTLEGWPVAGDVDGDGEREILIVVRDRIWVWTPNGRRKAVWQVPMIPQYEYTLRQVVLAGPSGRNGMRVLVPSEVSLHLLEAGRDLPGWPVQLRTSTDKGVPGNSVAADLDDDGRCELITGNGISVNVLNEAGDSLTGWPRISSALPSAAADLDGDGLPEVVAHSAEYEYAVRNGVLSPIYPPTQAKVWVFGRAGEVMRGWPKSIAYPATVAVIGDLDRDGRPEVVAAGGREVWAWQWNGKTLPGWPVRWTGRGAHPSSAFQPLIGDIDGDGKPEVVLSTDDGQVFAWKADGTAPTGWPRHAGDMATPPAIGDVDGDGAVEVVAFDVDSRNPHVWDCPPPPPGTTPNLPWPMPGRSARGDG